MEGLQRQMKKNGGILADGIEKNGPFAFGDEFAKDENRFRLELFEMPRERGQRMAPTGVTKSVAQTLIRDHDLGQCSGPMFRTNVLGQ
jgi:hypothetical protein